MCFPLHLLRLHKEENLFHSPEYFLGGWCLKHGRNRPSYEASISVQYSGPPALPLCFPFAFLRMVHARSACEDASLSLYAHICMHIHTYVYLYKSNHRPVNFKHICSKRVLERLHLPQYLTQT